MTKTAKIKDYVKNHPNASSKEIADYAGTSPKYVESAINIMRRKGAEIPARTKQKTDTTAKATGQPEEIKHKVKDLVKKGNKSLTDLSTHFNLSVKTITEIIDGLIKEGHLLKVKPDATVIFSNEIPKGEPVVLNVKKMSTGFYRFGVTGDNHLCSRYERLDVLNALYNLFDEEGITTVYNTGNYIDGEARFNKHDLHTHGLGNQVEYFVNTFPSKKGMTTFFITGDDHEGWYTQREGINVGQFTEDAAKKAGRKDLVYLGHMEADVVLKTPDGKGKTVIRVLHPGGGSSYAVSYTAQKIVESYTGGEKPDIVLIGHYHKAEYSFIRGVHAVQTATTMDQSPFMRKKRLAAHLGGWIIEFYVDNVGAVTRFKQEYIQFYDKDYYKKWDYKM